MGPRLGYCPLKTHGYPIFPSTFDTQLSEATQGATISAIHSPLAYKDRSLIPFVGPIPIVQDASRLTGSEGSVPPQHDNFPAGKKAVERSPGGGSLLV